LLINFTFKVSEDLLEVSHVDLVAEMMKDLVNKLKLDTQPSPGCIDPPSLKQEVLVIYNYS
jgi:hypothetical protein